MSGFWGGMNIWTDETTGGFPVEAYQKYGWWIRRVWRTNDTEGWSGHVIVELTNIKNEKLLLERAVLNLGGPFLVVDQEVETKVVWRLLA